MRTVEFCAMIADRLSQDKALEIVQIPLAGKSDIADFIVVASGSSTRHVSALARHLSEKLKKLKIPYHVEGLSAADWVLIDAGDVIIHLFRPEVRSYYDIEKLWLMDFPATEQEAALTRASKDTVFS